MSVKHLFAQTCQLIVLLNLTHTYVLFAANLDDFRSIAKKFIPIKLADQLANMAAKNSMKYRQQLNKQKLIDMKHNNDEYTDEVTEIAIVPSPDTIRQGGTTPKTRFAIKDKVQGVDFDELVDRVREKLEVKYKNKLKLELDKERAKTVSEDMYTEENKREANAEVTEDKITTEDTQMYYEDGVEAKQVENKETENDGMLLEADLTKTKDSYEDYVTPSRDNVFDSDAEPKTTKANEQSKYKANSNTATDEDKYKENKEYKDTPLSEDLDYEEHKSEEVRALTGSILDKTDQTGSGKPKKLKGTMIPTREYFKMSSPNYFAKLPAVAERYDFNEPLPEKDREPENWQHFSNPGARINKKVKV